MPGNDDAILDAVVGDIADLELRITARQKLSECITTTDDNTVNRTLDRFAKVKRSTRPDLWRWILLGIVLVLSLSMGTPHIISGVTYYREQTGSGWDNYEKRIASVRKNLGQRNWTRQQEALLFGRLDEMPLDERLRYLRQMAGQDPVMLGEYMRVYTDKKSAMPPDLQDLAREIDPDNAIFDYYNAALLAKDSVKETKRSYAEIRAKKPASWEIKDSEKLVRAMALLVDATAKPAYNSHLREGVIKRIPLLPWSTREERLFSSHFVFASPFPGFYLHSLTPAICAEAQRLATAGDQDGFIKLATMTETYWHRRLTDDDPTPVNGLMLLTEIEKTCEPFVRSAKSLGLEAEEKHYLAISDGLKKRRAILIAKEAARTGREPLTIRTSLEMKFAELMDNRVVRGPPIDETLLLPTAYADHALYSRALTLALCAMFALVTAFLMIHYAITSRMIRVTGKQIARLLDWKDYTIISTISFTIPVAYVLTIPRLTPYGAREFNLRGTLGILPATHFAALFLMMLILTVLVTQWRLRQKASIFGLRRGWPSIFGWISFITAALHVPLIGWFFSRETLERPLLYAILALLAPSLLWLISMAFRSLAGSFISRLNSDVLVRALIPSFGLLMIGILSLLPLFKAEEDYWIQQDRFVFNPEDPVFPFTYEKAIADRFNDEILQILKTK